MNTSLDTFAAIVIAAPFAMVIVTRYANRLWCAIALHMAGGWATSPPPTPTSALLWYTTRAVRYAKRQLAE